MQPAIPSELTDQVVVITGGSRGIGFSVANALELAVPHST